MIKKDRHFKIADIKNKNFFKTFIIAEIGINHNGKINKCKKLINAAHKAGADAIKLQTINPDESYFKDTASYKEFKDKDFSVKNLIYLRKYSEKKKLLMFSTPGDISSLNKIYKAGIKLAKVSSGLSNNTPLIEQISKKKIPILLSTGMTHLKEIRRSLNIIKKSKNTCVGILKCTSIYPAPDNSINLKAMQSLKKIFKIPVGLSDHTLDTLSCCSSVAMGGSIIEKHLTLNKKIKGADHKISLNPTEFKKMVYTIRRIEIMLGSQKIFPTKNEQKIKENMQRYIFTTKQIKAGEKINLKNVAFKRSNFNKTKAIKAEGFYKFKNKRLKKTIFKDQLLKFNNFKSV